MKPKTILIIEDEHALGSALSLLVTRMGHRPTLVASAAAGFGAIDEQQLDAAVIDIGLPDQSGLKVLESIRESGSVMPVLMITAHATLQHALDSQKYRATAYLNKPLDMEQFKHQLAALLEPVLEARAGEDSLSSDADSPTLIGAAPCMRDVFIGIARACTGGFPVFITGPGGSGKSLTARLIHAHGKQASGSLYELECRTIQNWLEKPEWLGGSVVLDEIVDLNPDAQAALAEWLHQDVVRPVRVIATTRLNASDAVEQGLLREDLYFALRPSTVKMPRLNERSSDIPALCYFFAGLKRPESEVPEITPAVMAALQAHEWPGNVRELIHVLDYAFSMSQGGALFLSHLPESVESVQVDSSHQAQLGSELELAIQSWLNQEMATVEEPSYDHLLQRLETELLKYLMARFDEKPTRLAAALNIHRGTLRQKLQRTGLQRSSD